jgi:hypothetical protein
LAAFLLKHCMIASSSPINMAEANQLAYWRMLETSCTFLGTVPLVQAFLHVSSTSNAVSQRNHHKNFSWEQLQPWLQLCQSHLYPWCQRWGCCTPNHMHV